MSDYLTQWSQRLYINDPQQTLSAVERAALYPEHVKYPQECAMVHLNTLIYRQSPRAIFSIPPGKTYPKEVYQRIGIPEPHLWLSKDASVTNIQRMTDQHLMACLRMAGNGKLDAFSNPRNIRQMFDLAGAGPIMFSTYTQEVMCSNVVPSNNIGRKLRSTQYLTRIDGVVDLMRMYQQVVIMMRNYEMWHQLDERYYNMKAEALRRGLLASHDDRLNDEIFEEPNRYRQMSLQFGDVLCAKDNGQMDDDGPRVNWARAQPEE